MFNNKLGDLDDFLAPSVECVLPLINNKKSDQQTEAKVEITPKPEKAKIAVTVNDLEEE